MVVLVGDDVTGNMVGFRVPVRHTFIKLVTLLTTASKLAVLKLVASMNWSDIVSR